MADTVANKIFAELRQVRTQLSRVEGEYAAFKQACAGRPRSVKEELDTIPGRRVPYQLTGTQTFTIAQNGIRGNAINFQVSQDGPFVWTHYPLVVWRPNLPTDATNFGRFQAVNSWPNPTQMFATDSIDLSYEMIDGGSQRNMQNAASGAGPFSRPDNIVPLPEWCVVAPNSVLQFVPVYEDIFFSTTPATDTTGGVLQVDIIGFRIVNL